MTDGTKRMVSIWTWSALILGVYGVLLLGAAILRSAGGEAPPEALKMTHVKADLWWPVVMLVVAGGLAWAGHRERQGE